MNENDDEYINKKAQINYKWWTDSRFIVNRVGDVDVVGHVHRVHRRVLEGLHHAEDGERALGIRGVAVAVMFAVLTGADVLVKPLSWTHSVIKSMLTNVNKVKVKVKVVLTGRVFRMLCPKVHYKAILQTQRVRKWLWECKPCRANQIY